MYWMIHDGYLSKSGPMEHKFRLLDLDKALMSVYKGYDGTASRLLGG